MHCGVAMTTTENGHCVACNRIVLRVSLSLDFWYNGRFPRSIGNRIFSEPNQTRSESIFKILLFLESCHRYYGIFHTIPTNSSSDESIRVLVHPSPSFLSKTQEHINRVQQAILYRLKKAVHSQHPFLQLPIFPAVP